MKKFIPIYWVWIILFVLFMIILQANSPYSLKHYGLIMGVLGVTILLTVVGALVIIIAGIISAIKQKKLGWAIGILLFTVIGATIYYAKQPDSKGAVESVPKKTVTKKRAPQSTRKITKKKAAVRKTARKTSKKVAKKTTKKSKK